MKQVLRQTRSHLMGLFRQHGLFPRGDLGQNFLIDLNILESIVNAADLVPSDVVLEVGTGTGGLTLFLAARAGRVVSVEYDQNMYAFAREQIAAWNNVCLLNQDALKNKNQLAPEVLDAVDTAIREQTAENQAANLEPTIPAFKLVANLPYKIGTNVISNLVATELPWARMVVTLQWELGERLMAKPGTSDYSALTVWLQSQCNIQVLKKLPPSVFWPPPTIDSVVLRIDPAPERRALIHDRTFFHHMVRDLFSHRRKLLRGTLKNMYGRQLGGEWLTTLYRDLGFGENTRAEELSPVQLVTLANRIHDDLARVGQSGPAGTDGQENE